MLVALFASALAAAGVYLIVSPPQSPRRATPRRRALLTAANEWLVQAGLAGVGVAGFAGAVTVLAVVAGMAGWVVFGGAAAAVAGAALTAVGVVGAYRSRRHRRIEDARQAWPRIIEEIRLQTGGLGRSVPQALLIAGRRAPGEMRPAFEAAEREWTVTTDFARTVAVLKRRLADPAADAVCETLLVANEMGGTGVDRRLAALVEDRVIELEGRRDAAAKQAGARFARRFVLIVPLGMAVTGFAIGNGRAAYETTAGQIAVALSIASVAACWMWAGRLLRLPEPDRVFADEARRP